MKELLKKFYIVRAGSAWRKKAWQSFKNNPDFLDRAEQAYFKSTQPPVVIGELTEEENQLITELREKVRALPPLEPTERSSEAERVWMGYKNRLREHLLTEDPRHFLEWTEIIGTMNAHLNRRNFNTLKNFSFWNEWKERLSVPMTHNQTPCFKFPSVDGAVMQQVYHLGQLRAHTGLDVWEEDVIIEFGAGFGAMCMAARGLGFSGEYIIYDWAEFCLLQEFYFKWHGVDTSNITFVSEYDDLARAAAGKRGLYIAMWSISESGVDVREKIFAAINPSAYLIGYQYMFGHINNNEYFASLAESKPDIEWQDFPCPHLPGVGNRYLMGRAQQ